MELVSKKMDIVEFGQGENERLDIFLTRQFPDLSRSRVQTLIKQGNVLVRGEVITKTGYKLVPGDQVSIEIPPLAPSALVAEHIPMDIIFENQDVLVVNKPAGMVVHPSPGHISGTLVHAALGYIPDLEGIGGIERPGVVHRLDKDTSGLIVIAKNQRSHQWLQDQFRDRKVEKKYLALVDGKPPTPLGRVEAPIGRSSVHRKLMAVVPLGKGRDAVSEFQTVETFPNHTLLSVHPLTGRTHQIRVHMAFLGCPISGDKVYGRRVSTVNINHHFLHAHELRITLLGEKNTRYFQAPLPEELLSLLDNLRKGE